MSNLLHDWYEWVKYTEISNVILPTQRQVLGRCLGPTKNEGNTMLQYVLIVKETIVLRRTVRLLTTEELYNTNENNEWENFDKMIQSKFGNYLQFPDDNVEKLGIEGFIDADEEIIDKPFSINGDPVSNGRA